MERRGAKVWWEDGEMYLCYDIKGIQRFIFSIPKLKCVIGGSGLIAEFDRDARGKGAGAGAEWVFSGGGRGAFYCSSGETAERLASYLVQGAHAVGLDIRIGVDESLSQAAHHADQLYPYCPKDLEGIPCAVSGIWPTAQGKIHPMVRRRYDMARNDHLGTWILEELRNRNLIPETLAGQKLSFFKSVKPEPEAAGAADDDEAESLAGQAALGNRNRWALVAMDGNDVGRQFQVFESLKKREGWLEEKTRVWLQAMSRHLEQCTREAFLRALGSVIQQWADASETDLEDCIVESAASRPDRTLILPFRPLILGGDDVTMLCHSGFAMPFVQRMATEFRELSRDAARQAENPPLWPATGDELTISGGILYAKVTFPLHLAIPYAESLLSSAKGRFRASPDSNVATPAAVDWDTITDSLVDTPAARRNRELRFRDTELGLEIQLTRRPYRLERAQDQPDLESLLQLKQRLEAVPRSVLARVLPGLQRPWSERVAFMASIAKQHEILQEQLWEDGPNLGAGWHQAADGKSRATGLPDALLLLDEEHRLRQAEIDY